MKKNLILALALLVAFFILTGTSYSFTKANVTAAIKKELAKGGDMIAIKIVLLNVSDVQTGIMQQRRQYNPYDQTTRVSQELPYEAKIKVNCVRKNNNIIMKTLTDDISGSLTRNKMGRYEISGVNSYSLLCSDYNIGCVSGNCENGLGVEIFVDGEDNDQHKVLFMGTYKNGKKLCGFETPLTSGWSDTTYADKFTSNTTFDQYENGGVCVEADVAESLLKAKHITKDDYDMYQNLPDEEDNEEED
jgi:hypothetical protein